MWRLHEQHTNPLTRIVHGLPISWGQSTATTKLPGTVDAVAWSLCSQFVAIAWYESGVTIEILDGVTLRRITVLKPPEGLMGLNDQLIFSPDAHLLTWFGGGPWKIISWDVQTGILVGAMYPNQQEHIRDCLSAAYSACGTMFGVSFYDNSTFTIHTYNVLSSTCISSYSIQRLALDKIWTHGDHLRCGTIESGSITIWEVGFTPAAPKEVESLPIPDEAHPPQGFLFHSTPPQGLLFHPTPPQGFLFHPTPPRLALITKGSILVWDCQDSKFLLDSANPMGHMRIQMCFSPDGHFFVCGVFFQGSLDPEICLWKESPTGYILHQRLISSSSAFKPLISPNGESMITFGGSRAQLWYTTDTTTSPSAALAQTSQCGNFFILGFSPDETLVAVTRIEDEMVTVLGLKSGTTQLIIDTNMKVYGLRVARSTIVVVGVGRIVTWNLPTGNHILKPRVNINDSIHTTTFNHPPLHTFMTLPPTSVSLDLHHIVMIGGNHMYLYSVSTGQCLGSVPVNLGNGPWFTPDGHEVWCVRCGGGAADRWKINKDSECNDIKLENLGTTDYKPDGLPWKPSHGYKVIDDQWVLSSSGRRLLWFPPHWWSRGWDGMWSGQFLALLHYKLPEAIILELE